MPNFSEFLKDIRFPTNMGVLRVGNEMQSVSLHRKHTCTIPMLPLGAGKRHERDAERVHLRTTVQDWLSTPLMPTGSRNPDCREVTLQCQRFRPHFRRHNRFQLQLRFVFLLPFQLPLLSFQHFLQKADCFPYRRRKSCRYRGPCRINS